MSEALEINQPWKCWKTGKVVVIDNYGSCNSRDKGNSKCRFCVFNHVPRNIEEARLGVKLSC